MLKFGTGITVTEIWHWNAVTAAAEIWHWIYRNWNLALKCNDYCCSNLALKLQLQEHISFIDLFNSYICIMTLKFQPFFASYKNQIHPKTAKTQFIIRQFNKNVISLLIPTKDVSSSFIYLSWPTSTVIIIPAPHLPLPRPPTPGPAVTDKCTAQFFFHLYACLPSYPNSIWNWTKVAATHERI